MDDDPQELLKALESINDEYKRAKNIIQKIEDLLLRFQRTQASLVEIETQSSGHKDRLILEVAKIEEDRNQIMAIQKEVAGALEGVKANIKSLQDGYSEFSELKGQVKGQGGEIDSILINTRGLKADIEKNKTEAESTLAGIKKLLVDVQNKVNDVQLTYESFLQLKGKIDDEKTGLAPALRFVQESQEQAIKIVSEIKSYRDESQENLRIITENKSKSEQLKNEIGEHLTTAENQLQEVKKVADLITDTGFANSFQERQKQLSKKAVIWLWLLIAGTVGLAIMLYVSFGKTSGIPEIKFILQRLSLSSPLLLFLLFAGKQYTNERNLEERYAFKATIATVMRNHTDFLLEKTKDTTDKQTDIICKTLSGLYTEPYETVKIRKNLIKSEKGEKKPNDLIQIAKELKSIFPESGIKDIIELFLKAR